MPAPSIAEQTGWSRPHPAMLYQGFPEAFDLLDKVEQYDFDLEDEGFQEYARQRGVLHLAGTKNSRRWKFIGGLHMVGNPWSRDCINHNGPVFLDKIEFLKDPYFQHPGETQPARQRVLRYDVEQMEFQWKIARQARARLQDVWEIYRGTQQIMTASDAAQVVCPVPPAAKPLSEYVLRKGEQYRVEFYPVTPWNSPPEQFVGTITETTPDGNIRFQLSKSHWRTLYPKHLVVLSKQQPAPAVHTWERPTFQIRIDANQYVASRTRKSKHWWRLPDIIDRTTGVRNQHRGIEETRFYYRFEVPRNRMLYPDGDIVASNSCDLLAEEKQKSIRQPFTYADKLWITTGTLSKCHQADQAIAWSLMPLKSWEYPTYTRDELRDAWNNGSRARGDETGLIVSHRGMQYVLSEMAVFTPCTAMEPAAKPKKWTQQDLFGYAEGMSDPKKRRGN